MGRSDMMLVTGASGFIGARLVERVTRERRQPVSALVHRLGSVGTARVAALPGVRLIHGEVTDAAPVDEATRGCEVVVHCAVDTRSAPAVQERVTTVGARRVIGAARKHGVRRVVYLSTAAVHSWQRPGTWDEDAPIDARDLYARSKRAAEELFLRAEGVPVTVIRPTCVYGPFSRTWTTTPVEFMRLGIPVVSADNRERANLIYIDNLVDLIVAASECRDDRHHVYLATEDEPNDWATLFSAYARTIGVPLLRYPAASSRWALWREEIAVSMANARLLGGRAVSDVRQALFGDLVLLHRHVPLLQRCSRVLPPGIVRRLSAAARRPADGGPRGAAANTLRAFAPIMIRRIYGARAAFSAERAKRELGWRPRVGASDAIDRTCAWIAFAGI